MKVLILLLVLFCGSSLKAQTDTLFYNKEYKGVTSKDSCDFWRIVNYKDSTLTDYYKTGEIQLICKFSYIDKKDDLNTVFEGPAIEFHENGNKIGFFSFKKGVLEGEYVTYYPNGKTKEFGTFKNGKEEGLVVTYTEEGECTEKYYMNGERCDPMSEEYRVMMAIGGGEFYHLTSNVYNETEKDKKKYNKYIEDFNPTKIALDQKDFIDGSVFWFELLRTNPNYKKFYSKSFSKNKTTKVNAFKSKASYAGSLYSEYPKIFYKYEDEQLYHDFIKFLQGTDPVKPIKHIYLINSEEKNAFALPDGTICLTIPLFYELKPVEVLGILAHEMAHYILDHALIAEFAVEKRENINKAIAAAFIGINIGLSASVQAQGGVKSEENKSYWDNVQKNNDAVWGAFENASVLYDFKYSREQEIEADIVAYRFLQYLGYDPKHYMKALGKLIDFDISNPSKEGIEALSKDYSSPTKYSDHPSILERCLILEYIAQFDNKYNQ